MRTAVTVGLDSVTLELGHVYQNQQKDDYNTEPWQVYQSDDWYWQTKWSWPWSESQRHWNMNKSKTKLDIGNGLDTKQFTWELGAMELLQKSCSCTLSGPQFLRFRSHLFNGFIWVTNGQCSSPQNVIKISTLFSFGQYSHGHGLTEMACIDRV